MLNKELRLTSNSSFVATYHQKKVVSDEFFVLYAGKNKTEELAPSKFGFVVSKKVHKRAVIRNKIKRRLREAVHIYIKENNTPCMSYILSAKENSTNANFNKTLKSVNKLFKRIATKYV